ncbi:GNAT family N-acetyltransferase [Portibacter lacus]|uniref:N-acetyltransferase n=1 Tax=Portibacter lacus TaxID=1099794 RepID=A0AA37WI50_9BACT|nr:GNAT family N-acetyltransferase [Portibacter lacus]GLR19305.1 N-acetyltransferase [Portibacter lacus]
MSEIIYRSAQSGDIEGIHNLVLELAIFEKEPDAVTVDVAYYKKCFEEGTFQAIVADKDGSIVGMTLFYMSFSTWKGKMMYLEDFVVHPDYRNMGIGKKLWDAWIQESKNQGAKMVKWQVLDWNTNATRFYEREGATIEKQWWNGKIIF